MRNKYNQYKNDPDELEDVKQEISDVLCMLEEFAGEEYSE